MEEQKESLKLTNHGEVVAIIGAGIVGLTMAVKLSMLGIKCVIYEKRKVIKSTTGREISLIIQHYGIKALKTAGIDVQKDLRVMRGRGLLTPHGTVNFRFEDGYIVNVSRQMLYDVLYSKVKDDPNIKLQFEQEYDDIDVEKGELRFQNNIEKFYWIFACDGAYSRTRNKMVQNQMVSFYQEPDIIVGYEIQFPKAPDMQDNFFYCYNALENNALVYPDFRDKSKMVAFWMVNKKILAGKNEEGIEETFREHCGPMAKGCQFVNVKKPNKLMARLWTDPMTYGKVTLLGDSAFNQNPFNGTGLNISLQVVDGFIDFIKTHGMDFQRVGREVDRFFHKEILASQECTYLRRHIYNTDEEQLEKYKLQRDILKRLSNNYSDLFLSYVEIDYITTARYTQHLEFFRQEQKIVEEIWALGDLEETFYKVDRDERVVAILKKHEDSFEMHRRMRQEAIEQFY